MRVESAYKVFNVQDQSSTLFRQTLQQFCERDLFSYYGNIRHNQSEELKRFTRSGVKSQAHWESSYCIEV